MGRRKLPPLPKLCHSALGPVYIEIVEGLRSEQGEELMGRWLPTTRTIQIATGLSPEAAWHTLEHEKAHVAFWDAGLTRLPKRDIEHACDAIATARVAEMLGKARG